MERSDSLIKMFFEESESLVEEFEDIILRIESDPQNQDLLDALCRNIHTIKGSSSMLGLKEINKVSHLLEDVVLLIKKKELTFTKKIADLILDFKDLIIFFITTYDKNKDLCSSKINSYIERIAEYINIKNNKVQTKIDKRKKALEKRNIHIRFYPGAEVFKRAINPLRYIDELTLKGKTVIKPVLSKIKILDKINPELCYMGWDLEIETENSLKDLETLFVYVEADSEIDIKEIKAVNENTQTVKEDIDPSKSLSDTIRVPVSKLDSIVNMVSELITMKIQVDQTVLGSGNMELITHLKAMDRVIDNLRVSALNVRMVPVSTCFINLKRIIRDVSTELGKKVVFEGIGGDTEIDKNVIELLMEPLIHIIRNSIDHGIELPEERIEHGKSETGLIKFSAEYDGEDISISIFDDGAGIDSEKVMARAVEQGLLLENEDYAENNILNLIFRSGFSTKEKVSTVSGRGVGMDVVKNSIEKINGHIFIDSEFGKYTRVDLTIPLSLSIIDGLLFILCGNHFIVPLSAVESCLAYRNSFLKNEENRNYINYRDEFIPCIFLSELFEFEDGSCPDDKQIIILDIEKKRIAVIVDSVVGGHQTVIKKINTNVKGSLFFAGASIMGDGKIALVIDLIKILDYFILKGKGHSIGVEV